MSCDVHIFVYLFSSGVPGSTDPLPNSKVTFPASDVRISDSQGKRDPKVTNAQNLETSDGASELAVQSLEQQQQITTPEQAVTSLAPTTQPSVAFLEPFVAAQQQYNGPSDSLISKVTFGAAQAEDQKEPSGATSGTYVNLFSTLCM